MFISIIQPVYNAEKYLEETILSVIRQSHKEFEYILINDGSIDSTSKILKKYSNIDNRIKILEHEINKGYIAALNYGILNAKYNYIFRIDSDDIISEFALSNRITTYSRTKNCALVSGLPIYFSNSNNQVKLKRYFPSSPSSLKWSLLWGNPITHSSSFFSKSHFNNFGGYIDNKNLEDWDLWNKFQSIGNIILSDFSDIYYRLHESQSTRSNKNNPHFKKQVISIIKSNLSNYFRRENIDDIDDIDDILWAMYTDTDLKDISIRTLFKSIKFYNYSLKLISLDDKYLNFFIILHKFRMINRLKGRSFSYLLSLLFFIIKSPKIIFLFTNESLKYLEYLKSSKIFFNNLKKINEENY